MEAKVFIRTLKSIRTRYSKKPNAEAEKKSVMTLVENIGGKLEAIATLNENGLDDLKNYIKGMMGVSKVAAEPIVDETSEATKAETPAKSEEEVKPADKKNVARVISKDEDGNEYAECNGKVYIIDSVKKTMKRVYNDLKSLADVDVDEIALSEKAFPMTTYQRYLKDHFPGEDTPIKKGKLHFRGYRISCDPLNGFVIEDTTKRYEVVETPFEGIPTPKELGEWFKKPKREFTAEEEREAVERGKEFLRKKKEERDAEKAALEDDDEEPDFEALRRKVLRKLDEARSKTVDVDPESFTTMIPFKRWKRKVKSLYTQWKNRKIRYAKYLNEIEKVTTEETFVIEEKRHRSKFIGTFLPDFRTVGMLKGNLLEVDGKWVAAVPFLVEYLLHYEKRVMSQYMKFAKGEITDIEFIKNPIDVDWRVEYKRNALENTAYNAAVLCMVYSQVGIIAPQDLLYEADLKEGDVILLDIDGELKRRTIISTNRGITMGKEVGLLKLDKWIKLPKKEKKEEAEKDN